jgi:Fic family protein
MKEFIPHKLPLKLDVETKEILKKVTSANKALAMLNGVSKIIPNQNILINSLVLQEAKDSSEIENIITTHDEIYQGAVDINSVSQSAKEVQNYSNALIRGFSFVKNEQLLLNKHILEIQSELEQNDAGFRRVSGTMLKNAKTGEIKHIPPQKHSDIVELMENLQEYINDDSLEDFDPLIKMAIIHFQFEAIHPFYDGNGRTGRIINILYLVYKELLDLPILYLSSYIIQNKSDYYKVLQGVQNDGDWKSLILYILDGVEQTAKETTRLIEEMQVLMQDTKQTIKAELPKIYSKDLIEILFSHPYTKIEFLVDSLELHRDTAAKYLNSLESIGILKSVKLGRTKFFINVELFDLLKKGI